MVIEILIKVFTLNFITYYISQKILKEDRIHYIKTIVVSILTTAIYMMLRKTIDDVIFLTIVQYLVQLIFIKMIIEDSSKNVLIGNLISNAITYILWGFAGVAGFLPMILKINNSTISIALTSVVSFILLSLFMRMKRITNGLTFLDKKTQNDYLDIIVVPICTFLILAYCIVGNYYEGFIITKQIFVTFALLAIILFIMIQKTITMYYKQRLLQRTIEDYKEEIANKDKQIEKLSDEKFKISKVNHEFYNRQKALTKKVTDFISNYSVEIGNELTIIDQINDLTKSYSSKLEEIKTLDKLPATDIIEVDDMLRYMQAECRKNNIYFILNVNGNIHHMVNKLIPQDKLVTLIGDHLRDAIIAVNHSKNPFKSIIVFIGEKDKKYEFCVHDTGIDFTIDTLVKLGLEPATTHKDEGGTGIGFITTFETMKSTGASLIIQERHEERNNDYTKSVTIRFDGKNEYRIYSYRANEIKSADNNNRIKIRSIEKVNSIWKK